MSDSVKCLSFQWLNFHDCVWEEIYMVKFSLSFTSSQQFHFILLNVPSSQFWCSRPCWSVPSPLLLGHTSLNLAPPSILFFFLIFSAASLRVSFKFINRLSEGKLWKKFLIILLIKAAVAGVALQIQAGTTFEETNYCRQPTRVYFLFTSLQGCSQCYCLCFMSTLPWDFSEDQL